MSDTDTTREPDRLGTLALVSAIYTYALLVYGGIVRITGSGMGCGDDWPDCSGRLVPTFDLPTFIEYSHRVLAGGLALLTLWVLVEALRRRDHPLGRGQGGLLRPAWLAAGLIFVQVLLGAVTVKLELPALTTALHFVVAMVLLATFLALAIRAGAIPVSRSGDAGARLAIWTAGLGFVVLTLGALTANVGMEGPFPPSGAAMACQGFPLCNGQLWPEGGSWVQIHWLHRLLAFALAFLTVWAAWRTRQEPPPVVASAAVASAVLVVTQIGVAAALVLTTLPDLLQTLHLAVGGLVWSALVLWALLASHAERASLSPRGGGA